MEDAADSVFTDYVRSQLQGEPEPSEPEFDEVWDALKKTLRVEMKRKSLWGASPRYLGFIGHAWSDSDALEDLAAECFRKIFVEGLRSLQGYLGFSDSIEGVVVYAVRNLLHELQTRQDPLGAQVYRILRRAVRQAVEAGWLHVLEEDVSVRADTVLGFEAKLRDARGLAERAKALLVDLAAAWNDQLMPELVLARTRALAALIEKIHELLRALPRGGIRAFEFGDLVRPLQTDARKRWAGVYRQEAGETVEEGDDSEPTTWVPPETEVEDRQFFQALIRCVGERLRRLEVRRRTSEYLYRLWKFLRFHASTSGDTRRRPANRELSRQLGIPRDRLPELFETLGGLVEDCRDLLSGRRSR